MLLKEQVKQRRRLRIVLIRFNQQAREDQKRMAHYFHEKRHIEHDAEGRLPGHKIRCTARPR